VAVGPRRRSRGLRARGTDRLEDFVAWLLTSLAAGIVLLAVAIGQLGHDHTLQRASTESAARTLAAATLLEDADGALLADGARPRTELAQWTTPDGREVQGRVVVSTRHVAGDVVSVWLDRTGHLVAAPINPTSASVVGWTWGLAVVLAGWAVLALLWTGVHAWTAHHNAATWARDWAMVEPTWSGRVP
jgi:hypothetical protein